MRDYACAYMHEATPHAKGICRSATPTFNSQQPAVRSASLLRNGRGRLSPRLSSTSSCRRSRIVQGEGRLPSPSAHTPSMHSKVHSSKCHVPAGQRSPTAYAAAPSQPLTGRWRPSGSTPVEVQYRGWGEKRQRLGQQQQTAPAAGAPTALPAAAIFPYPRARYGAVHTAVRLPAVQQYCTPAVPSSYCLLHLLCLWDL